MAKRYDIQNEQILEMLKDKAKYPSDRSIARVLGCTRTIVRNVRLGLRDNPKKKKDEGPICTCCNARTVAEGFRFLCRECYRNAGENPDDCTPLYYRVRAYNSGGKE